MRNHKQYQNNFLGPSRITQAEARRILGRRDRCGDQTSIRITIGGVVSIVNGKVSNDIAGDVPIYFVVHKTMYDPMYGKIFTDGDNWLIEKRTRMGSYLGSTSYVVVPYECPPHERGIIKTAITAYVSNKGKTVQFDGHRIKVNKEDNVVYNGDGPVDVRREPE